MLNQADLSHGYEQTINIWTFETPTGLVVHAVPAANWEACETILRNPSPLDGLVIFPELITFDPEVTDPDKQLQLAQQRVNAARELSIQHPGATLLIGAPTRDESGTMRNSLVVLRQGRTLGVVDKEGPLSAREAQHFSSSPRNPQQQTVLPGGCAAIICSDVIAAYARPDWVSGQAGLGQALRNAQTVVVASRWAVTQGAGSEVPYREALDRSVRRLLQAYPNIQQVIFVDAGSEEADVPPFATEFRREAASGF